MNYLLSKITALIAGLTAALLTACGPSNDTASDDGKPVIVATTTMVTDLARSLAGDDFTVLSLMGPGVDPHLFKPGQEDIQRLQKADVVLYSGLHLEGKMADIFERFHGQGRKVFAVADGFAKDDVITAEGQPDPHIWGDASLWTKGLTHCAQKLSEAYPDKAAAIGARAAAAALVLTETHARLKARVESLPPSQRVLVTSHDAFPAASRGAHGAGCSMDGAFTAKTRSRPSTGCWKRAIFSPLNCMPEKPAARRAISARSSVTASAAAVQRHLP